MTPADVAAAPGPAHNVLIRPATGWRDLRLGELWGYRELTSFFIKRELQVRYKQSLFGISWVVMQPLVMAFVFTIFLGQLAGLTSGYANIPYPVFLLAGLVPWMFTAGATNQMAVSLVADANLLSKVYFPRLVLPLAKIVALLFDLAIAMVVLFAVTLLYGLGLNWHVIVLPAFLLLDVLTVYGVGVLFAAVNVKYRDVGVAVPLLTQVWLFASPVVYTPNLSGPLQYLYTINPMVSVLDGIRWALLGTPAPSASQLAISISVAVVVAVLSTVYFRRTEQFFADIV